MTERSSKKESSIQKAYGLIRRSGVVPLVAETVSEERPWRIMASLILEPNKDKFRGVMQFVGQTTLKADSEGNSSGNMVVCKAEADGTSITVFSFERPQRISGKKNGALKKEVLSAIEKAAENPGMFVVNRKERTITAIYRKNRDSVEKLVLPLVSLIN